MSNQFALERANIVILARNYNPSIVSKEWLYEKNIIRETVNNFVHTPLLSHVETAQISLILDENRLQLSLKNVSTQNIEVLTKIATDFISCLPETPYIGLGFNYRYNMPKRNDRLKELFSPDNAKLRLLFSGDYHVGFIISFTFKRFITRISVPPVGEKVTSIVLDLNYHSDCRGAKAIKERLKLHPTTLEKTEEILKELTK